MWKEIQGDCTAANGWFYTIIVLLCVIVIACLIFALFVCKRTHGDFAAMNKSVISKGQKVHKYFFLFFIIFLETWSCSILPVKNWSNPHLSAIFKIQYLFCSWTMLFLHKQRTNIQTNNIKQEWFHLSNIHRYLLDEGPQETRT